MSINAVSDFWLDDVEQSLFPIDSDESSGDSDLILLASRRRLVSNFVCILTNKNIPVKFINSDVINCTDGKTVWLSASIKNKLDFDWSIGLALHEASHIILSDFSLVEKIFTDKSTFLATPEIRLLSKSKNVPNIEVRKLCKWVFNFVEDRYIDSYIFNSAPGYRGYYKAMYNKFWNSKKISEALKSESYRTPNLKSYFFRVVNLTNPNTDLNALPELDKISELIDMEDILRLSTCNDRLHVSYKVVEIILENIDSFKHRKNDEDAIGSTIEQLSYVLGGQQPKDDCDDHQDEDESDDISSNDINGGEDLSDDGGDVEDDLEKQRRMLDHDFSVEKKLISKPDDSVINIIEKNGVSIVLSGRGLDENTPGVPIVKCIVVEKMDEKLIRSNSEIFPMSFPSNSNYMVETSKQIVKDSVIDGFVRGKQLGKKLQVYGEETITKFIRRNSGKIERKLLADIGSGVFNIFQRSIIHKWNKSRIHISIDASESMAGPKWYSTMKCITSICVAASTLKNLDVSVSFRCTHNMFSNQSVYPYIMLGYDSTVDKISKVRHLFPMLCPHGGTPEGLAFEAIMDNFIIGKKSNEQEHYLINISDGEPYFTDNQLNISYVGDVAIEHTRRQIESIRSKGVKVLSYFITTPSANKIYYPSIPDYKLQFSRMYGNDAKFIDVTSVNDISKTINTLFISNR